MEAYFTAILNKWFQDQTDFNKIMKINVNLGGKNTIINLIKYVK